MKMRVQKILKQPVGRNVHWNLSFYRARILRKHASLANLKNDFTILDTDDQLRLMKQVISNLDLDENSVPKVIYV